MCLVDMSATPNVRRRLFAGSGGRREQLNALLESVNNISAARFRDRWNFDIITDTALEGTYKWSSPRPADIPAVYSRGYDHKCRRRRVQRRDPDENSDNGSRSTVLSQAPDVSCVEVKVMLGVSQASCPNQVEDETTPPRRTDSSHLVASRLSHPRSAYEEREAARVPAPTIQTRLIDFYSQTKKINAAPDAEPAVCVKKRRTDS